MDAAECVREVRLVLQARIPGAWHPIIADDDAGPQTIFYTDSGAVFKVTPTALKCVIGLACVPLSLETLTTIDEINATMNTGNAIVAGQPVAEKWNIIWNSKFPLAYMETQGLRQFVVDWSSNATPFADHFGHNIIAASGGLTWRSIFPNDPFHAAVMLAALS